MAGLDTFVREFTRLLKQQDKRKTSAYDTTAKVKRIDGDVAWVHIAGGIDETPVKLTVNAEVGDSVQVRVSGGRAWITGNSTNPPTDDKRAIKAHKVALGADNVAKQAKIQADLATELANNAQESADENAEAMAEAVLQINSDIEDLQTQIDGNITSWFYTSDPSMSSPPVTVDPQNPDATGWDTDEKKQNHVGDLYYNTTSGYVWRFVYQSGSYQWLRVTDSDVTRALQDAAKAQDTADSKRRVFYTTPTPPYDAGDLWVQGSGGDILRCAQARPETGSYSRNDWVLASKYTDNSVFQTWLENDFAETLEELEEGITDAKIETYYQTNDPSSGWSATEKQQHTGDMWYNSTASVQKYYRWSGSAWTECKATPPQTVFDQIDGKANIFVGSTTPTGATAGDLWFKGTGEPILTYVNNSWVEYNKYTDNTRANAAYSLAESAERKANTAQSTADGKNKVYRQDTQPTGTFVAGDIWFDTANDNKIYRHNGTSWVAVTLGDDAIDNLSANKLTAGTIDASQITVSNLDAGNITTGKLGADYIEVSELSIGQSQVTNLVSDLGNKANSSDVPTKVSDLTNDSNFQTGTQVESTVTGKGYQTSSQVESAITSKGYQTSSQVESAITSKGYQTASDVSSAVATGVAGKADKSVAVKSTVSLYYRSTTNTAPTISTSTTIGTSATTDNAWEYVMPQPKRDRYFFTCEKYTFVDNSVGFSTVRALTSETYASKFVHSSDNTYIDGGKIYANSITADKIVTSGITIGQSQVTNLTTDLASKANTSSIPTKVSQLTNDSSFATTTQVGTAKSEAISTASSDATSKANAAQTAAISAAASDATTKANAAAKTASDNITSISGGGIKVHSAGDTTSYTQIKSSGIDLVADGTNLSHIGKDTGQTESDTTSTDKFPYYTFGVRSSDTATTRGNYSFVEGYSNKASGYCSHAEGYSTEATGRGAHAEGYTTHATGMLSHSEGAGSTASGVYSHVEGQASVASGRNSHAQNRGTKASGENSHAGGYYTTAGYENQTAIGKYNNNKSTSLFEIGKGTSDSAKANAFAVTTDGALEIGDPANTFVVVDHSISIPAITKDNSKTDTATFTKSGYYPVGVMGYNTGREAGVPSRMYLSARSSGSATVSYSIRATGANYTATTMHVFILWIKVA